MDAKDRYLYGTLFALVKEQLDAIDVQVSRGLGMWAKMRFQARTKEIGKFVTKIIERRVKQHGDQGFQMVVDDLEFIEFDEDLWHDVTSAHVEYIRNVLRG